MNCVEKFNDTELPKCEGRFSFNTTWNIHQKTYIHAQHIWAPFSIKTMGECSDLHLKVDVLLLVDGMNKLRQTCVEHYKLDPSHILYTAQFFVELC